MNQLQSDHLSIIQVLSGQSYYEEFGNLIWEAEESTWKINFRNHQFLKTFFTIWFIFHDDFKKWLHFWKLSKLSRWNVIQSSARSPFLMNKQRTEKKVCTKINYRQFSEESVDSVLIKLAWEKWSQLKLNSLWKQTEEICQHAFSTALRLFSARQHPLLRKRVVLFSVLRFSG